MTESDRVAAATDLVREPSRRSAIDPFIVMDVMRAANAREASGERIIHMEVGQPGTRAPEAARAAARKALETDRLGYTEALGLSRLREGIADLYRRWYGLDIAPERIVCTTGSSTGFVLAFLALFDPGARIALPAPGYPCYRHILASLDLEAVTIETGAAGRWMPLPEDLDRGSEPPFDGLLMASPANPTGTMASRQRLEALATACEQKGLWFISDEIYHGLTYEAQAETVLALSDRAIVINSFSKYFSMTGWRIGWMVVPEALVRTIERLAQNLFIAPPTLSQYAAIGALEAEAEAELEGFRRVYGENRALLLKALTHAGLATILPADGAFYLYADVRHLGLDSRVLARRLLEEAGVAATPGVDFDAAEGRNTLRFSYAGTTADMAEGAHRIANWMRSHG